MVVQQTLPLAASAISLGAYSTGVAQQACAALATSLGTDPVCSATTSVVPAAGSGRRLLQVCAICCWADCTDGCESGMGVGSVPVQHARQAIAKRR